LIKIQIDIAYMVWIIAKHVDEAPKPNFIPQNAQAENGIE
jgi:hypothetical protein